MKLEWVRERGQRQKQEQRRKTGRQRPRLLTPVAYTCCASSLDVYTATVEREAWLRPTGIQREWEWIMYDPLEAFFATKQRSFPYFPSTIILTLTAAPAQQENGCVSNAGWVGGGRGPKFSWLDGRKGHEQSGHN